MELLRVRTLNGPNYWSNFRKRLIVADVDLKEFENQSSKEILNFNDNLKNLIPSLYEHYCSENHIGGFFSRLDAGTWLGHVIEHVALEIQNLAGMNCGFGRTRSTAKSGIYNVVISYEVEKAGHYAAQVSFNIVRALAYQQAYTNLKNDIEKLKEIYLNSKLGPSTASIVAELKKRHIPYSRLDDDSLILIGQGVNQKIIMATETSSTSIVSAEITADKVLTKQILHDNFINVPQGFTVKNIQELEVNINRIKYPLVIKPKSANHGRGVTTRIHNYSSLLEAFKLANQLCDEVIVEEYIEGYDYRVLMINNKVVAVAKREPAKVIGDGHSTIQELIDSINTDNLRGKGHENYLTEIDIDQVTLNILHQAKLSLNTVLKKNQILYLKYTANISNGATAEDVTDIVHPDTIATCERVSRILHLDICGIDLISKDIKRSLKENNGSIIEVNTGPGFRMHIQPTKGKHRNVAANVVDMLYPENKPFRIPIVAVTGTNGKTTVVRLLAQIASSMGHHVGFTTTDGIYIHNRLIHEGDCSGPMSARAVLRDPSVDFAVLECARGGIIRRGLGFDECDISIVTNITGDHLGLDGIDTIDDLVRVKAVVPRSTSKTGYAILNADDELVYDIRMDIDCQKAYFSIERTDKLINHIMNNEVVCYLADDEIFIENKKSKMFCGRISEYPFTLNGLISANIKNLLPVFLASYLQGFNMQRTIKALKQVTLSSDNLPGRMNIFEFKNGTILLDYAHNPAAYEELKKYIVTVEAKHKIGIIAATGDRREIDIIALGKHAGEMFDEIIIRHDKDSRGRTNDELTSLLVSGINQSAKKPILNIISDEFTALSFAITKSKPNTFILYFPDDIVTALSYLKKMGGLSSTIGSIPCHLKESY